jgi:acyl-CoA hydrolase
MHYMTKSPAAAIAALLRPGMRIAVADGAGAPVTLADDLTDAAASVGGVRLVLGWCLDLPVRLEPSAFTDIRTVMGGFALRTPIAQGLVRYVPERLSAVPSLFAGPLRPDALVIRMSRTGGGWAWGTEVSWMSSVVDSNALLLIEEVPGLPQAAADAPVPLDRGVVVATGDHPPRTIATPEPDGVSRLIGQHVAGLVSEGSCLQFGPGPLATAVVDALTVPVHVRSGLLSDAVLNLAAQDLLLSTPIGTYLAGSADLYRYGDGRAVLTRVERTHQLAVAEGRPLITVNTALEVDRTGAVNVEGTGGARISGIGGHADFLLMGHASTGGLSIVATPATRRGCSTLVDRLSFPASATRTDVDVVVTEHGVADLRGLDDAERGAELTRIWTPPAQPAASGAHRHGAP